ncbi:serine hydrolase domain-containing protein [Methylocapsa aurea]|uniref:serine hydrolase domain-containing protein n=1 Tax=Methylocapsa aurea TaxID=663610 RepID=UPI00068C80FC|nr:serine hydrolase domain-containing protein [Methylocapsa aurea]
MHENFVTPISKWGLSAVAELFFTAGFIPAELDAIDRLVGNYMGKYSVPGLSIAITKDGRLVYAKGFGQARKPTLWDRITLQAAEDVSPWSRFRIASVTKPFTVVAIFKLVEQGRLSLADKVFGAGGVFGSDFGFDALTPEQKPSSLAQITVQHLLEHASGGWQNDSRDPMFVQPELTHQHLIAWVLRNRPLENQPGAIWAYSNFGFCLLGRIIERVSGQPYADYVRANVLAPCGITTMEVAGDTLAQRRVGEVVYYGQPYYIRFHVGAAGTSDVILKQEDDPYAIPVARMDSHGGWIASAIDLVRFAVHVDAFSQPPDILSAASIATMTTPTTAREFATNEDPKYAKGWDVRGNGNKQNWFHDGILPGTTSLLVRDASGFCWAALMNTRQANTQTQMIADLDQMIRSFIFDDKSRSTKAVVSQWPTTDHFHAYDDPWKSAKVVSIQGSKAFAQKK